MISIFIGIFYKCINVFCQNIGLILDLEVWENRKAKKKDDVKSKKRILVSKSMNSTNNESSCMIHGYLIG